MPRNNSEIETLRAQLAELTARIQRLEGGSATSEVLLPNGHTSSRRDVLKLAGAAVVGAAGAAALRAVPVHAGDGDHMLLGAVNTETLTTSLLYATAPTGAPTTPMFVVAEQAGPLTIPSGLTGAILGIGAPNGDGVEGRVTGALGAAIFGESDVGYGVLGASGQGIDVAAQGTGRVSQLPWSPTPGAPAFTPDPNTPEIDRDASLALFASRATGSGPAAWRRMNSARVDAADGSGTPLTPTRIIDTRPVTDPNGFTPGVKYGDGGNPYRDGEARVYSMRYAGSPVPGDAVGIIANLTATEWNGGGFLSAGPAAALTGTPTFSNLNFGGSAPAWANFCVLGLDATGSIKIFARVTGLGGRVHVLFDIFGYIQ